MGKRTKTTATFEVKIEIPTGSNCHEVQLYIREAIESYQSHRAKQDKMTYITADDFTVALKKRETTYA